MKSTTLTPTESAAEAATKRAWGMLLASRPMPVAIHSEPSPSRLAILNMQVIHEKLRGLTQKLADLPPVQIRQHDVQQDEVRSLVADDATGS